MSILRRDDDERLGLLWRIVMVLVVASLIWLGIMHVHRTFFGAGYDQFGHATSAVLTSVLIVPSIVLARRYLDRRPLAGLGLVPLVLVVLTLRLFVRDPTDWRERASASKR